MREKLFKFFAAIFFGSLALLMFCAFVLSYVGVLIQYTLVPITLISFVFTCLLYKSDCSQ
jgi:hypothetical protein